MFHLPYMAIRGTLKNYIFHFLLLYRFVTTLFCYFSKELNTHHQILLSLLYILYWSLSFCIRIQFSSAFITIYHFWLSFIIFLQMFFWSVFSSYSMLFFSGNAVFVHLYDLYLSYSRNWHFSCNVTVDFGS